MHNVSPEQLIFITFIELINLSFGPNVHSLKFITIHQSAATSTELSVWFWKLGIEIIKVLCDSTGGTCTSGSWLTRLHGELVSGWSQNHHCLMFYLHGSLGRALGFASFQMIFWRDWLRQANADCELGISGI